MGKIGITPSGLETYSDQVKELFLLTHPVGSLYFSLVETSPEILFGGKWVRITNAFIMCAGDQYPAGTKGGSATVNLSHTHTTRNHTLTVNEMPSHGHSSSGSGVLLGHGQGTPASLATKDGGYFVNVTITETGGSQPHNHGATLAAGSTAQSIIPPYVSYYCWQRQE